MHFVVHGDFLTEKIRDMWRSDLPKNALDVCFSMNMKPEDAFQLILGKKTLTGTSDDKEGFGWEDDLSYDDPNTFRMDLSIDGVMVRLLKNYKENLAQLTAQKRTERLYMGQFDRETGYKTEQPLIESLNSSVYRKETISKLKSTGFDRVKSLEEKDQQLVTQIEALISYSSFKLSDFAKIAVQVSESFEALSDEEIKGIIESRKKEEWIKETYGSRGQMMRQTTRETQERSKEKEKNFEKDYKQELERSAAYREEMIDRIMRVQQLGVLQELRKNGKGLEGLEESYLQALSDSIKDPEQKGRFEESREFIKQQKINDKIELFQQHNSSIKAFNQEVLDFNKSVEKLKFMSTEQAEHCRTLHKRAYSLNKERDEFYDKVSYEFRKKHELKTEKVIYPVPDFVEVTGVDQDHAYITPDGRFYPTFFEGHIYLEQELFKSGLYPQFDHQGYGNDWMGENLIKISSGEIQWGNSKELEEEKKVTLVSIYKTEEQIETLMMWMLLKGQDTYNTWMSKNLTPDEVIQYIKDREN